MPIAKTDDLENLLSAVKYYYDNTSYRVMFEYILFDRFNDTEDDITALANLAGRVPCKINLLAYNPVKGLPFRKPSDDKVDWFAKKLYPQAPIVTVRQSRGSDINAACGQLAAEKNI